MNQFTVSKLRQLTDTLGRPLWAPSLSADMPNQLLGKPYYIDPAMPSAATSATSIAFGDFAAYFIRDVAGLRFERSVDYAFNTDLNTYRAILRTDGRLLDLTAPLAAYKGGTA
jgi:HK97 family phage major capsid protein